MDKFTVFREMLDYAAHMGKVTDADMNYVPDMMKITAETEGEVIEIDVTINKKEVQADVES
jgi:hypothetical protein